MIAYGWLAWLLLFLAYEIPAAIAEVVYARRGQRRAITLSRNVWRWFGVTEWRPYRTARRVVLAAFMLTLTSHFVFAHPEAWAIIATGAPVALVIGYAVLVEDRRVRAALAYHAEHVRADEEVEREAARGRVRGHLREQFARHDAGTKGGQ